MLNATVYGLLREKLLNAKLYDEAQRLNIPHVTVLHIHNSDPATPEKMLKAMPKLPGVLNITLKTFYTTEAAKGAGHPWWLDLGIVKEGAGYEAMMAFNTTATPILTALRDGPLPRVTGPVYAVMSDAGERTGADGRRQRAQHREGRQGAAAAQSAQHAGLFDGEVHAGDPGGVRPDRQGVQPDPARRHPDLVQDGVDRRARLRRQRAARDLSASAWKTARCSTSRRGRRWRSNGVEVGKKNRPNNPMRRQDIGMRTVNAPRPSCRPHARRPRAAPRARRRAAARPPSPS